jgi:hypothetical protein
MFITMPKIFASMGFGLPIGIAFLLKSPHLRHLTFYLLLLLTIFLWLYNGVLLVGYLLG